jgi:hypothetical protein
MRLTAACGVLMILAGPLSAAGQHLIEFEIGVLAGTPFSVPLESTLTGAASVFSSQAFSRPPVSAGPTFAVVVQDRIAIQFDSLYKRMRFNNSFSNGTSYSASSSEISSWEFPLIADYAMLQRPIRPFAGGGLLLGQTLSRTFLSQLPAYVINGGLDWRMSRLVIRPELRYTRWSSVSQSTDVARRENQFEFLVGFSFRGLRP